MTIAIVLVKCYERYSSRSMIPFWQILPDSFQQFHEQISHGLWQLGRLPRTRFGFRRLEQPIFLEHQLYSCLIPLKKNRGNVKYQCSTFAIYIMITNIAYRYRSSSHYNASIIFTYIFAFGARCRITLIICGYYNWRSINDLFRYER